MDKVYIKNLRSITENGSIQIKPITILVGKNSIGKSTFLRTFPLIKQTLRVDKSEPILWYSPDLVDFGTFKDSVTKTNKEEPIEFGYTFRIKKIDFMRNAKLRSTFSPYQFYNSSANDRSTIDQTTEISINTKFYETYLKKVELNLLDYHILIEAKNNEIVNITINDRRLDIKDIYFNDYKAERFIPMILLKAKSNIHRRSRNIESEGIRSIFEELKKIKGGRVSDEFINNIAVNLELNNKEDFNKKFNELISSRKTTAKKFNNMSFDIQDEFLNNIYILNGLRNINIIIEIINKYMADYFSNLQYIAPIRATAQRYYRIQGISISEISPQGENIPMLLWNMKKSRNGDYENWTNWTKNNFDLEFSVVETGANLSVNIIKNKEIINLADTGFGFSQIIPILLYLWDLEGNEKRKKKYPYYMRPLTETKTLVIEQPELHLHPALQAKLMDVFIQVILKLKDTSKFSIIMETHSDVMIKRIGYNIIKSDGKINPELFNILLFKEDINGNAKIEVAKYTPEGYLTNWPLGFFLPEQEGEE